MAGNVRSSRVQGLSHFRNITDIQRFYIVGTLNKSFIQMVSVIEVVLNAFLSFGISNTVLYP